MSTPLLTALQAFAHQDPLRMAMPGHKGQPLPALADYAAIDFTELPPTGNLYEPGGPIEAAETLWAQAWGADACLFLTGGSTQGIHTALLAAGGVGAELLVDRVVHRSIHTGMALLDQRPVYLTRPWLAEGGVVGPLDPETVEKALDQHPNVKTVCITSPTYYGVLSDIGTIGRICHDRGAKLVVDGAHGAHLFLTGENPYQGADFVVTSAHKTLRAPGQSALLFANGSALETLRRASMMFATSSPAYPMMAALDACRDWYEGAGRARYRETLAAVEELRRCYPALQTTDAPLDPGRFVLCVPDGYQVEAALQAQNIWPEMADRGHVVFILTDGDDRESITRLCHALDALGLRGKPREGRFPPPPPLPRQVMTPRAAAFGPQVEVPLAEAQGAVVAQQLAPYPPGVPICAPGEVLDKKNLSYLQEVGYNKTSIAILPRI